jgi:hypothetical protein
VKALNGDKASGHGGYSMAFFQACWVVSKEDIMKVFHDLHARGKFERGDNSPTTVSPCLQNLKILTTCFQI